MNIMMMAGLTDQKLISKIAPIASLEGVENIFLFRREPFVYDKVSCFFPPRFIRWSRVMSEFYRFFACLAVCCRKKIDRIIGIHYFPHCLLASVMGFLLRRKYIMVITEEPQLYERKSLFWNVARRAEGIAVRGSRSKEYLISKGILESKVFAPPNVFAFQDIPQSPGQDTKYDVIFIGYFVRDKRMDILLQVLNGVKKQRSEFKALIVGDGPLKQEIQQLTSELNLEENIDFAGIEDDIYHYLQQSRILILTSETEGLPMVIIEAMSCGVPCVVPHVGDIPDIARDNENAIIVEPLNVDQFSQACIRLLEDQDLYNRLSQNARNIRNEKSDEYSMNSVATIWRNVLVEGK